MKWACGVLIAAAIFTTLVSSLKIVSDGVRDFSSNFKRISALSNDENKAIVVFGCLVVAYPLSFFGFDNIVDNLYPFNSVCGVILTCLIVLRYFVRIVSIIVKKAKEKHARKRAKSTLQSSHNSYASHQENPHVRTRKNYVIVSESVTISWKRNDKPIASDKFCFVHGSTNGERLTP